MPALLEHVDEMPPDVRRAVVSTVCVDRSDRSWLDWNLAAGRADRAREEHCPATRHL